MKKLIPYLLFLCAWSVQAQNFEGTIKWSMTMEFADPAMKAQMEAAMKMMPGGADMMPKGFAMKMKGSNVIVKMEGGPIQMEVLYLKEKDQRYSLNRKERTYSVLPGDHKTQSASAPAPKVTKTSETMKILGYSCTKYLVETSERGQTMTSSMWTSTEVKDVDWKTLSKQRVGRGQSLMVEGVEGFPLRIESSAPEGSMVMEVTEIKKEALNAADFTVPADYKETQGMSGMPGMH